METINIVNNSDQKIIIANLLITNQHKLLNMCKNIFSFGYLSEKKLSIAEVKDYLNRQKFINWELFINLINLESEFYEYNTKSTTNSLKYLIRTKSYKLIEFLLDLDLDSNSDSNLDHKSNIINWQQTQFEYKKQPIYYIFESLYTNDNIINKAIDLIVKNHYQNDLFDNSCVLNIISKCSESVIKRLFELKLIPIDWMDYLDNNLFHWISKRNFFNLFNWFISENANIDFLLNMINDEKQTPLHLACFHNNIDIVRILVKKNVPLESTDIYSNYPLTYAIEYGNSELIKLLLEQDLSMVNNNPDFLYQMIKYQDEQMVKYFIEGDFTNINNTNLIWTMILCTNKQFYSQMYSYGSKKITLSLYEFLRDLSDSHDGLYIDDPFDYVDN